MNEFFISKLNSYYTNDCVEKIISNMKLNKYITFRLNECYIDVKEKVELELKNNNIKYEILNLRDELKKINNYDFLTIKSSDNNFSSNDYLNKDIFDYEFYAVSDDIENELNVQNLKNKIFNLDIYKNGYIYIQNPSTFLSVLLLEPKANEDILDMCAAPGGKSLMIQSITKNKTNLTACEINNIRYKRMLYNFKIQNANVYTLNTDVRNLDEFLKFEKILVDAPCSGSGTFDTSNTNYEKYFTDYLIDKSVERQISLLKKAKKIIKDSGIILYSTCSILNSENEDIIKNIDIKKYTYVKILPTKLFEGFFAVRFEV